MPDRARSRIADVFLPVVGLVALIGAWQAAVSLLHISPAVLPRPIAVLTALRANAALLLGEGRVTLVESVDGFGLAFALGVPLAVAISGSALLSRTFTPLLVATQSLPKVALAPMILVWLGTGLSAKLAIAWLVAFFPIVVDTATGLRATPPDLLDLAAALRANPWQIFWKIRLPAALPFILSGAKVAVTLAVIGAVIGEFISSDDGLGNLLLVANAQLNTSLAFAALVALAILGLGLYGVVAGVERVLRPWIGPRG